MSFMEANPPPCPTLMQELNNMQVNNETEDSAAAPVIRFVDLVITQAIKEKGLRHSLRTF